MPSKAGKTTVKRELSLVKGGKKDKAQSEAKGPISAHPYVDEEGYYRLTGELFWKYRAADSDFSRVQSEMKTTVSLIERIVSANPDLKQLFAKRQELMSAMTGVTHNLKLVQNQIQKELGIDLKNCAIDDRTGRIHIVMDGQKPQPFGPNRKVQIVKPDKEEPSQSAPSPTEPATPTGAEVPSASQVAISEVTAAKRGRKKSK